MWCGKLGVGWYAGFGVPPGFLRLMLPYTHTTQPTPVDLIAYSGRKRPAIPDDVGHFLGVDRKRWPASIHRQLVQEGADPLYREHQQVLKNTGPQTFPPDHQATLWTSIKRDTGAIHCAGFIRTQKQNGGSNFLRGRPGCRFRRRLALPLVIRVNGAHP